MEKYKYNNKQNVKTSMDIGEITPIYWNLLYPGETLKKQNFRNITRMITPIYPTLDNPEINIFTFAVPTRLLLKNDFGETELKGDIITNFHITNEEDMKVLSLPWPTETPENPYDQEFWEPIMKGDLIDTEAVRTSGLLKKFGFTKDKWGAYKLPKDNFEINYLLAYWKIYNDFFKNKQLEKFNYEKVMNVLTMGNRETTQKWNGYMPKDIITGAQLDGDTKGEIKMQAQACRILDCIALGNTKNQYLNQLQFENTTLPLGNTWEGFKKNISDNFVNNQRLINKVQKGTYKDTLINVWNTDNGGKTNVILLGYEEYKQNISQVVNQAKGQGDNQSLGEIGGLSVTYNEGNLVNDYTANEPTIIMSVAVPNYEMTIKGAYDYFEWVENANKFNPENDIPNVELYGETIPGIIPNQIIGYAPNFEYLRNKKDIVAGEILDNWSNWTYTLDTQKIWPDNTGKLGLNLLKVNKKPFKDTLVSTEQDSFITEWEFETEIERVIKPEYMLKEEAIKGE